jgi:hypothetical protein
MAMKELDEVLTDVAEHRHQLYMIWIWGLEELTVETDDELMQRFLRTFYPDEHKKYF